MNNPLSNLHRFIAESFDLEELRTLCFGLGVEYDDLGGTGRSDKARELLRWMGRRKELERLVDALRRVRPGGFDEVRLGLTGGTEALYAGLPEFEAADGDALQRAEGEHSAQVGGDGAAVVGDDNVVVGDEGVAQVIMAEGGGTVGDVTLVTGDYYVIPSLWSRFRRRPEIFYPTLSIVILLIAVALVWVDVGGAKRGLQERCLLPGAFPSAAQDKFLIVVFQFDRAQGADDLRLHQEIGDAIQQAAQERGLSDLRVEIEPTRLQVNDQARAKKLGQCYNASIIIWGGYTRARVTVNYLNLKQADFATQVKISETRRTQLANPSAYARFVTEDLPGQLTFLSLFAIGQAHYVEGAYDESIAVIERAIAALAPDVEPQGLAEAHFRLGWLYQALGNAEQAISDYDRTIELDPNFASAYNNRGMIRYDQGDLEGAVKDYEKAIELDPDDPAAYNNLGNVRADQENWKEAMANYDQAIQLDPDSSTIHNNRGSALSHQGDLDGAIRAYDRAIELDPDNAIAYCNRGNVRLQQEDYQEARFDYDQAIELDPNLAVAHFRRGLVQALYSYDIQGALGYYDRAIELDPNLADAFVSRGMTWSTLGNPQAALPDLRRYLEIGTDADMRQQVEELIAELEAQISEP